MSRRTVYECDACGAKMGEGSHYDRHELRLDNPDDKACNRHLDLCGLCASWLRQCLADRKAAHHRERPS